MPVLAVKFPSSVDVDDLVRELLALPVPVHLGQDQVDVGTLVVNPMALQPGHGQALATSILTVLTHLI